MKWPSLHSVAGSTSRSFIRFPLVILMSLAGTFFCILWNHSGYGSEETRIWYWQVIQTFYLGMLFLLALSIFAERRNHGAPARVILQAAGLGLILLYYFSLPGHFYEHGVIRLILYALALHWLIAVIPFLGYAEANGFWQYNKILFLRILTAALYSGVLFAGLSVALLAIEKLFQLNIKFETYGDLWLFLAGIFNTWFFLAGFPREYSLLDKITDYPRGLKIFTQYVLLPIICIYLVILYLYGCKILVTGQWPAGWVSYLVLSFSAAGIFSLLLIHPIRHETGNRWILGFSRFFYIALLPLLLLLFFAIFRRVAEYGITELRYFVLLLAFWLLGIALYFLVSRAKNIKRIPASLCLIALLSSFGPWGAFGVSLRSQRHRLIGLLKTDHLLTGGKVTPARGDISFKDREKISALMEYLLSTHGYASLQDIYPQRLDSMMWPESKNDPLGDQAENQTKKLMALLNLNYVGPDDLDSTRGFYVSAGISNRYNITPGIAIGGYDYLIKNFNEYVPDDTTQENWTPYVLGDQKVDICFQGSKNLLIITPQGDSAMIVHVDTLLQSLQNEGMLYDNGTPQKEIVLTASSGNRIGKVMIQNIGGKIDGDRIHVSNISADILLGKKRP